MGRRNEAAKTNHLQQWEGMANTALVCKFTMYRQ